MFIVCDESTQGKTSIIGGVSIVYDEAVEFEKQCFILRHKHKVFGEIKWANITSRGKYFDFYLNIIKHFFKFPTARFHSNSYKGNQYTAGYSLVMLISLKLHGINLYPKLDILFDGTGEKGKQEAISTRKKLANDRRVFHKIRMCNQTDSNVINLAQVADLITGCVAYKIAKDRNEIKNNVNNNFFAKELAKMDYNLDINFSIKRELWGYDERKIQHYDLLSYLDTFVKNY